MSFVDEIIRPGELVVDLGCGNGAFLESVPSLFEERIGLDIKEEPIVDDKGGPVGWRYIRADLNARSPLEDGCADLVRANQVIEHIINPYDFAREIYRITRQGGRVIVTSPNVRYVKNIWRIIFSGYGPRTAGGNTRDGAWDDGHLHYFTHKDLREVFSAAGFRSVHSEALVDMSKGGTLRSLLNRSSRLFMVREFLSGNILVVADK